MDLPSLDETIRRALTLQEPIYLAVQQSPRGLWVAMIVVGLAGLSQALGQSLVLFINHVRPRRFIFAVVFSAISYMLGYILWTASVWLVGVYAFGQDAPWAAVAAAVGLAYAPQLFAFFELMPFLGAPFGIFLSLWSLLAVLVAVRVGLGLELWQAAVASGLGWLLIQVWRRTIGRPIYALGRWLERLAAGTQLEYQMRDLPTLRRRPAWLQNMDQWRQRRHVPAALKTPEPGQENGPSSLPDKDAVAER